MRTARVNFRISVNDLKLLRKLANDRGIPYQTLLKSLLHMALKREIRRVST